MEIDALLAEVVLNDAGRFLAKRLEGVREHLEDGSIDAAFDECLGHLDADVAAADDRRCLRIDRGHVIFDRVRLVHATEGEHALQVDPVERRFDCTSASRDQKITVGLIEPLAVRLNGDGFRLGIDRDDLVARSEVDVALLAELLGCHGDEVLEVLWSLSRSRASRRPHTRPIRPSRRRSRPGLDPRALPCSRRSFQPRLRQ